ncbi:MAG TPA: response regulator transcription factor [Candidatus Limnocylindria bacterium]|nr:response regulator transcription factor [Candidatus Limnocylindria bacterium]
MKKILLVEDHLQMARSIETILTLEGYEVVLAVNGPEGVAAAKREHPDLILCDVTMPGFDGFELLRQIRDFAATRLTPFIFLTAKAERADQRSGMNLGADDYLTKPVSRDELLATLQTRLARAEAHAEAPRTGTAFDFTSAIPLETKLGLTPREAEVLLWVAQGKSNADIASILGMAEKTVKKHLGNVFDKLGVEGRNAATVLALEVVSGRR